MARRKANDLENQMSLMDMMASESPEYTEEGPEELLDPSEDTGDSDGQTDKPFKLVANKTTKAKASISTQALSVVKAVLLIRSKRIGKNCLMVLTGFMLSLSPPVSSS